MSEIALEMDHVFKKFKKGELFDSLRDLLPALAGRLVTGNRKHDLGENEFWAVRDVSFQVDKGDAFGVIGPNGAGKSTILKLLCGIIKPNAGTRHVSGKLSALIEVGAGFHPDLTGRENVFLNGIVMGMKKEEIRRKFDSIVAFSGLEEFIDTPVKRYSSGMYARLGFAVASHVDPDVLIVDEVLSVGDFSFQNKCAEKMEAIRKDGATVIFVSHNLKAVATLCNKALLLHKGATVQVGDAQDVIEAYMRMMTERGIQTGDEPAYISNVTVRNPEREGHVFRSGQRMLVDVEITARKAVRNLRVTSSVMNTSYQMIFHIATDRLGQVSIEMLPGERQTFTFELTLHLTKGSYHVSTALENQNLNTLFDLRSPAASIYVDDNIDIRGYANLQPRMVAQSDAPENIA